MDNKVEDDKYSEPFSHPRWKDVPWGETIRKVERTEEEQAEIRKKFRKKLKEIGVLKED
ncbi:hypothetical protein [Clostridioides difficile]|uniref:hypothetical protein n=1 Tax=Clostridioides difficile TaxID=1496 RepID=UPI0021C9CA6D|nr:hypothetical protein [Clostridioides difficile]UUV13600.1 hypothetical protein NQ183_13585 [Clostridioides difficile]